jgi:hypothetical protein
LHALTSKTSVRQSGGLSTAHVERLVHLGLVWFLCFVSCCCATDEEKCISEALGVDVDTIRAWEPESEACHLEKADDGNGVAFRIRMELSERDYESMLSTLPVSQWIPQQYLANLDHDWAASARRENVPWWTPPATNSCDREFGQFGPGQEGTVHIKYNDGVAWMKGARFLSSE